MGNNVGDDEIMPTISMNTIEEVPKMRRVILKGSREDRESTNIKTKWFFIGFIIATIIQYGVVLCLQ